MIKNNLILEVKREERVYQLHLPSDSPLGEVHDVLHEMKMFIVKTMTERASQEVGEPKEDEKVKEKPNE